MSDEARAEERNRFEAMFSRTRQPLLGYIRRRTPDPLDAADLLAEVYLVAWRRRGDMPHGDGESRWLYAVARNLISNDQRRDISRRRLAEKLGSVLAAELSSSQAETPDVSDDIAAVRQELARLSPTDRDVIHLVAVDGLTPAEVASLMGTSAVATRVRLHRARKRLAHAIESSHRDHRAAVRSPPRAGCAE